jgi:hypothetical protein
MIEYFDSYIFEELRPLCQKCFNARDRERNEKQNIIKNAIKVDIKTELFALPNDGPIVKFFHFGKGRELLNDKSLGLVGISHETKTYQVVTVHPPARYAETLPEKHYLVPMNELGLFQDLCNISDHLLDRLLTNRNKEFCEKMKDENRKLQTEMKRLQGEAVRAYILGSIEENCRIKNLKWWERLLRKF